LALHHTSCGHVYIFASRIHRHCGIAKSTYNCRYNRTPQSPKCTEVLSLVHVAESTKKGLHIYHTGGRNFSLYFYSVATKKAHQ